MINGTGNHEEVQTLPDLTLHGLNFSPYGGAQSPTWDSPSPSREQIQRRLEIIAPFTNRIRTFHSLGVSRTVVDLALELGFEVAAGAWISPNRAENEAALEALLSFAAHPQVTSLVIGNEVGVRGDLPIPELLGLVQRAKAAFPNKTVTTVVVLETLKAHPEIAEVVDEVYVNLHPFFADVGIDGAFDALVEHYEMAREIAVDRPVLISETGWPSRDGQEVTEFFLQFLSWAQGNEIPYFYFSAFDEPWKAIDEGPFGAQFGIWRDNERLKPGYRAVLRPSVADPSVDSVLAPGHPHADLPTISIMTVCMGRLHHLKHTLLQNMKDNQDYPRLEFVVLDYNSPDGMQEWILENCAEEIASGYLRYYHFADAEFFRFSHSRNLAFRLSEGRIVCNVDADNYTGKDFAFYVAEHLHPGKVLTGCKIKPDGTLDPTMDEGTVGRLAAYREAIHHAGGFDEEMESWGYEDMDLYERLRDLGYELDPVDRQYCDCIPHGDAERAQFVEDKNICRPTAFTEGTCFEHAQLSEENRRKGRFTVNEEGYGLGKVRSFRGEWQDIEVKPFQFRKISYCITSMNRLHHVQETLVRNIADNRDYPRQEFVVLDYNSGDGLSEWIQTEMKEHLESGLVKLYQTKEPSYFVKSHAMNMAFRQAEGDIVVNLDADNFTGRGFSHFINDRFDRNEDSFLMIDMDRFPDRRDAVGRIAMRREDFHRVRGYDERMGGYGWEDFDICHRLSALGLEKQFIDDRSFLDYICHDNVERIKSGQTFKELDRVFKLLNPAEEYHSLYYLFRNQTFILVTPAPRQRIQGQWRAEEKRIIFNGTVEKREFVAEDEAETCWTRPESQDRLEAVTDEDAINGAIIWYHLSENEILMQESMKEGKAVANAGPYGEGTVSRIMAGELMRL